MLTYSIRYIPVVDFVRDYRDAEKFLEYCKQCGRYGNCWACPPFEFDSDQYLSGYSTAMIIGAKVFPENSISIISEGKYDASLAAILKARQEIDQRLLAMEKQYVGSRAFFAGTCHLCDECTRKFGKSCLYPEKVRPSLESLGFDLVRTSSEILGIEMKWGDKGQAPEYFTLVSGLFTNYAIEDLEWKE